MNDSNDPLPALRAPGLARRMACFIYEGVLLFGVVVISAYLYGSLTQQRNALEGRHGLQAFVFVCMAIYFAWFWSHGGQTVAMKAWRVRVVDRAGAPISQGRAIARYVLSWLWFLPALALVWLSGIHDVGATFAALAAGVIVYALLAQVQPERQFVHDILAGTRLIPIAR